MQTKKYLLKITCIDKAGLVAELSTAIFSLSGFITAFDQYSDPDTNQFFMRAVFEVQKELSLDAFQPIFKKFQITAELRDYHQKPKLLILCSKESHCLNALLSKHKTSLLPAEICAIASNHNTLQEMADWYKIPFHHLPVTPETKAAQEQQIAHLAREVDYIILARYMQILLPEFCNTFFGKIINIHHSFLPSFKGASPYLQAYKRGVKVIGATAHFVTPDLDEGPIIHQETLSVDHSYTTQDLAAHGADIEAIVLSKAVKHVIEGKVFIDKNKTVVFK